MAREPQNELKSEFEDYVKKLTTAICKDMLLEKMEDLYAKYESGHEKYVIVTERSEAACASMEREVKTVDDSIRDIREEVRVSLDTISHDIDTMEDNTAELLKNVKSMDELSRQQFITELGDYIEKYKGDIAKTFDKGCEQISDKLAGAITPQGLQDFIDSLDEHTREVKEIANFINVTYQEEIEKNIKFIISSNLKAQKQIYTAILSNLNKITEHFRAVEGEAESAFDRQAGEFAEAVEKQTEKYSKYLDELIQAERTDRDNAIKKQTRLVERIAPSDEKIQKFQDEVEKMRKLVEEMNRENKANYELMDKKLSANIKDQNKQWGKWYRKLISIVNKSQSGGMKAYIAFINTLLLFALGFDLYLQWPWAHLEKSVLYLIGVGLIVIMLLQAVIIMRIGKKNYVPDSGSEDLKNE